MENGFVALDQDMEGAGATTWWMLSGPVQLEALRTAWLAEGLPEEWLPEAPSPEQRLGRAVRTVSDLRHLARPVTRRGHWALVHEVVTGEGDAASVSHRALFTARIPAKGSWPLFSEYNATADAIERHYSESAGILERDDVALWLVAVLEHLSAIPVRPRGGVYYVLPTQLPRWRAVATALGRVGAGAVVCLPTMRGDEAQRAILLALQHQIETETQAIQQVSLDGSVGKRALRARAEDCGGMLNRLTAYEGLLGPLVDGLRATVEAAQQAAEHAALALEALAQAEADGVDPYAPADESEAA
jgi:hypothetical protein